MRIPNHFIYLASYLSIYPSIYKCLFEALRGHVFLGSLGHSGTLLLEVDEELPDAELKCFDGGTCSWGEEEPFDDFLVDGFHMFSH